MFRNSLRNSLESLSKINRSNVTAIRTPAFSKHLLSLNRRLLFREIRNSIEDCSASSDDGVVWQLLSDLYQSYRFLAWKEANMDLNLLEPRTLAEKLEWLKFNYHRKVLVQLSDKLQVRNYVVEKTSNKNLLNRIHGIYNRVCEIPIDSLPNRFVIKTNHWSGDALVCTEKETLCFDSLIKFEKLLVSKYRRKFVEWPYWHIEPKVFIEEYLQDQHEQLVDYKVFCLNGKPRFIMVWKDRNSSSAKRACFDSEWKLLPFGDPKHPIIDNADAFPKPDSLDEMLIYATKLSAGLAFIRVDFYDVFGECRFGEITLYPQSGLGLIFEPMEWNAIVGGWLRLPEPICNPKFAFGTEFVGNSQFGS